MRTYALHRYYINHQRRPRMSRNYHLLIKKTFQPPVDDHLSLTFWVSLAGCSAVDCKTVDLKL